VKKPIIISITNNKGGVAKTALSVNLSAALANKGYTTCLIDMDTQANATQNLIGDIADKDQSGIITALLDQERVIKATSLMADTKIKNLYILPNERKIGVYDVSLSNELEKELDRAEVLRKFLNRDEDLSAIDYIVIDNSPSKDLTVTNSLFASDYFLIPTTIADGSLNGVESFIDFAMSYRKFNPNLEFLGVVLTMVDKRRSKLKKIKKSLEDALGERLFNTMIPTNSVFDDLTNDQKTIFEISKSKNNKGVQEYTWLAEELIEKTKHRFANTETTQEANL
jgi:chromosome partitioning protein